MLAQSVEAKLGFGQKVGKAQLGYNLRGVVACGIQEAPWWRDITWHSEATRSFVHTCHCLHRVEISGIRTLHRGWPVRCRHVAGSRASSVANELVGFKKCGFTTFDMLAFSGLPVFSLSSLHMTCWPLGGFPSFVER